MFLPTLSVANPKFAKLQIFELEVAVATAIALVARLLLNDDLSLKILVAF